MEYVYLGRIVNTHGIKGEVRIMSDFERKSLVFKKDFKLYIGNTYNREVINSYRIHKNYDMITFKGINDINDVLKYKGSKVYIKKEDLNLGEEDFLYEDLIGMRVVCENKNYGVVIDVVNNKANVLLKVKFDKIFYIPYIQEFIKEVNLISKTIEVERIQEFYEI